MVRNGGLFQKRAGAKCNCGDNKQIHALFSPGQFVNVRVRWSFSGPSGFAEAPPLMLCEPIPPPFPPVAAPEVHRLFGRAR